MLLPLDNIPLNFIIQGTVLSSIVALIIFRFTMPDAGERYKQKHQSRSQTEHALLSNVELEGMNDQQQSENIFRPTIRFAQADRMATAHPTPGETVMACTGQFLAQAPHSIHRSGSRISSPLSVREKMRCGQTRVQLPQPTQRCRSTRKVAVPSI